MRKFFRTRAKPSQAPAPSISARLASSERQKTLEELKALDDQFRRNAHEEFERLSRAKHSREQSPSISARLFSGERQKVLEELRIQDDQFRRGAQEAFERLSRTRQLRA